MQEPSRGHTPSRTRSYPTSVRTREGLVVRLGMAEYNLQPLFNQVQAWWTDQHAGCQPQPPRPRPGLEGLEHLWNYDTVAVSLGVRTNPMCGLYCGWKNSRTRDQLVGGLRWRIKASAVEAAGILEQPDVRLAQQIASALVPQPFGTELTLVTDLIEAAGAQTVQGRDRAMAGVGIALLCLAGYFLTRG